MSLTSLAALGGLGFVLLAIVLNLVYVRAGVPLPGSGMSLRAATDSFAAAGAAHDRGSMAGLWALSNVLFGFNQVFLAIALLGFTVAGVGAGLIDPWHAWLGYLSAALLFVSSSASPYNTDGNNRIGLAGLIGWLGWAAWIVAYSITLLRL
ncbi:MAG: hypothetical protein GEV11_16955 [Streptosporangiales bacterium]|nr:hypothetical protein [Streptosporangiales bacterium]